MMLFACSKEKVTPTESFIYDLEIPVYEQENVSHYNVEVSKDGKTFTVLSTFPANKNMEYVYSGTINLTKYFTANRVFVRIKSVDIDASFLYSPILTVYK